MRMSRALVVVVPLAALSLAEVRDATACGGDFQEQSAVGVVDSHRMIVSISKTQTTLWDQIKYTGNPASFGWVLPTKGLVTIDVSSDALFSDLDQRTTVTVDVPPSPCVDPCSFGSGSSSGGSGGGNGGGPVVIAEKVVGPYQTVQLAGGDPVALTDWLATNGYVVPADIVPVIDAYVAEGFGFLAIKLLGGVGVDKMKPVRVTTPGAGLALPLRMVAAGTGNVTAISLWVLSEGRYEPTNFPSFEVVSSELVWDWKTNTSNYDALVKAGYTSSNGLGWLVAGAVPFSGSIVTSELTQLAQFDPLNSGYGDAMGMGAVAAAQADVDTLFGSLDPAAVWITRLEGQLPRVAFANDLVLGASASQNIAPFEHPIGKTVNPPTCPTYPPCSSSSSSSGMGGAGGATSSSSSSGAGSSSSSGAGGAPAAPAASQSSGCSTSGSAGDTRVLLLMAVAVGARLARRRRRS